MRCVCVDVWIATRNGLTRTPRRFFILFIKRVLRLRLQLQALELALQRLVGVTVLLHGLQLKFLEEWRIFGCGGGGDDGGGTASNDDVG